MSQAISPELITNTPYHRHWSRWKISTIALQNELGSNAELELLKVISAGKVGTFADYVAEMLIRVQFFTKYCIGDKELFT